MSRHVILCLAALYMYIGLQYKNIGLQYKSLIPLHTINEAVLYRLNAKQIANSVITDECR